MYEQSKAHLTVQKLRPKHHPPSSRHAHAVHQRIASQVEIDERRLHAHFSQSEPQGDRGRATLHEDGHHIARRPALRQSPLRHGVRPPVQLGEAPHLARGLLDKSRFVRVERHLLGEYGRDGASRTNIMIHV